MKIFQSQPELLSACHEEVHLVRRVRFGAPVGQHESAHQSFSSGHGHNDQLLQSFGCECAGLLPKLCRGNCDRTSLGRDPLNWIVNIYKCAVLDKLRRESQVLKNREPLPIDEPEPGSVRFHQVFQLLQGCGSHWSVLRGMRDGSCHLVESRQSATMQSGLVQDDQEHAQSQEHVQENSGFGRNVRRNRGPIQVKEHQSRSKQPRPNFPSRPPVSQQSNRGAECQDAVRELQGKA